MRPRVQSRVLSTQALCQRLIADRSGKLEHFIPEIWDFNPLHTNNEYKKIFFFHSPRVLPGKRSLIEEPVDSSPYEIAILTTRWRRDIRRL